MCAKNISVTAVKKKCLKLLAKLFTWKFKYMRTLFSFNYNLCDSLSENYNTNGEGK